MWIITYADGKPVGPARFETEQRARDTMARMQKHSHRPLRVAPDPAIEAFREGVSDEVREIVSAPPAGERLHTNATCPWPLCSKCRDGK